MTSCFAAILALTLAQSPTGQWPTLGDVLRTHQIDANCCDDANRRITSYRVQSDPAWFGIAYYWHTGTDALPSEVRVRTLDRRTRKWRSAVLDAEKLDGGSVIGLAPAGAWLYLDLHRTPSAGALIVLAEDLTVKKRLDGWSSLILPDGRVAYEHSMVHFAPFHAGSVSLYDPRTDRDVRLYPEVPDPDLIEHPLDRSIHPVESDGPNRIRIGVKEQRLKWAANARTEPDGPERRFVVTCDVSGPAPRCVRGPLVPAAK